ncbi:MAG: elongation factor P maturation arginine rhamnosyltransferase EarP, partial [Fusobacteriaceae bacterium]
GEDSFVRAVLSGKPFLWHIYFQEEEVHMEKLKSFLLAFENYLEKNSSQNKVLLKKYRDVMCEYNRRDKDSTDENREDYNNFFENLNELKKLMGEYSDYILKNHDLVEKLNRFIEEKML